MNSSRGSNNASARMLGSTLPMRGPHTRSSVQRSKIMSPTSRVTAEQVVENTSVVEDEAAGLGVVTAGVLVPSPQQKGPLTDVRGGVRRQEEQQGMNQTMQLGMPQLPMMTAIELRGDSSWNGGGLKSITHEEVPRINYQHGERTSMVHGNGNQSLPVTMVSVLGDSSSRASASSIDMSCNHSEANSNVEKERDLEKPPSHYKNLEDVEMWYFHKKKIVDKSKATVSSVQRLARNEVFRYIKFVDDENEFLKPDPRDTSLSGFSIISSAMRWKEGEERTKKWNTYGKAALGAIRQARSQAVSKIMSENMKGKLRKEFIVSF